MIQSAHRYSFVFVCLLFFGLCSGCGFNVPVSGTVTFEEDGSPLTKGSVVFTSEDGKYQVMGEIDDKGRYHAFEDSPKKGMRPGKYMVSLYQAQTGGDYVANDGPTANATTAAVIPLVDSRYNAPDTSGLSCTVERGKMTYDFVVTKP